VFILKKKVYKKSTNQVSDVEFTPETLSETSTSLKRQLKALQ